MNIIEAKKVLIDAGYVVTKVTDSINKRMNECASGENEDCLGCSACVCLLTPFEEE